MHIRKKKILLVQFRKDQKAIALEQACFKDRLGKSIKLAAVSIFDNELTWGSPDKILDFYTHIIFGGSFEFGFSKEVEFPKEKKYICLKIKPLILKIFEKDHPSLGVCYGHHLLGYMYGSKITRPENQHETGSVRVSLTNIAQKDKLFKNMPKVFLANTAHIESIEKLPKQAQLLASSENCPISAIKIKNNIYGLQFHPEMSQRWFKKRVGLKVRRVRTSKIIENFLTI